MRYFIYKVSVNRRDNNQCVKDYYFLDINYARACRDYLNTQREYWFKKYGFDEYGECQFETIETYDDTDFLSDTEEMKKTINEIKKGEFEEFLKPEVLDFIEREELRAELAKFRAEHKR